MLCGGLLYRTFLLATICTPALPTAAHAAFDIASHGGHVDTVNRPTSSTITFPEPPDFFATNDGHPPNNAFQFFYDAEPTEGEIGFAAEDVVIIRGAEILVDNTIPIRDSLNPSGEQFPNAEGWGEALGAVDFELDGQTITFTAGWELLRESDDVFGYRLYALAQGELTSEVTFLTRILVPLPTPLLGGAGLLLASRLLIKKRI